MLTILFRSIVAILNLSVSFSRTAICSRFAVNYDSMSELSECKDGLCSDRLSSDSTT